MVSKAHRSRGGPVLDGVPGAFGGARGFTGAAQATARRRDRNAGTNKPRHPAPV